MSRKYSPIMFIVLYYSRTPSESAIDTETAPHLATTRESAATYLGKYHEEAALKGMAPLTSRILAP